MIPARALVPLLLVASCTDLVQLAPDPLGDLVALEVKPRTATVTITDLAEPAQTLKFQAIGVFSDGSRRDVTKLLAWTVDNPAPGLFYDPGVYTTSNTAAGHVAVTATADSVTTTAALTVIVDATVVDTVFPPSDSGLFDASYPIVPNDPARSPQLTYPTDGTLFPQGVASTLFQYTRGSLNDAFRLTFDTETLHLVVLTGTDRWDTGDEYQNVLARSAIGETLQVGIEAASSADAGTIYGGTPVALEFDRDLPDSLVYFWSAATNGVMRGALGSAASSKLYPATGTCVGCHTLSRDGTQMAMGYGGEKLQTIDVASLATEIDVAMNIGMGWATYSPDGSVVLVANNGGLTLYDAKTGMPAGTPTGKVTLPVGHYATHPDWSPDGNYVAIAYTTTVPTNMDVQTAGIARLPVMPGNLFGTPQLLVAATGTENNYFPKYSPDGRYLAYVHATGTSHGAASAELLLVGESGGVPMPLFDASHRVGQDPAMGGIADTMPSWSPIVGDRAWLAFASARPYGNVLPAAGRGQIWIAAVDLAHVQPATDPSRAAFWLPCQDVTVLNNNPIWAPSPSPPQ